MSDVVLVQIPVTPEAAAALDDEERLARIGKLVSDLLKPSSPGVDPLAPLIAEVKQAAHGLGLTDQAVDAELDAYNGENRLRR